MSDHDQIPALRAIEGGAHARTGPTGRLALVGEHPQARGSEHVGRVPMRPIRPGLPRLDKSKPALVYTTLAALARVGLEACVEQLAIRQTIDLRVSPGFAELGLEREGFVAQLEALGVTYWQLDALANPYVKGSWHAENYRQRLLRFYRERARAVVFLRRGLEDGPVLVLAEERSAIEFELLVRALERAGAGFEAHALPPM